MTGKIKLPALEIFMTAVDAVEFSKVLKDQIESVKFITQHIWPDLNIPTFDVLDMEIAKNINFSIINTDILSIEDYKKNMLYIIQGQIMMALWLEKVLSVFHVPEWPVMHPNL